MRFGPVRQPVEVCHAAVVVATSTTIVVAGVIMAQHVLSAPPGAFATASSTTATVAEPALAPTTIALAGLTWVLFALYRRRDA